MIINGTEFYEDSGDTSSPSYQFAGDSARVIRSLHIRGSTEEARHEAIKALMGFNTTKTDPGAPTRKYISRRTPHGYPALVDVDVNPDAKAYLYVTGIPQDEPVGAGDGVDGLLRAKYLAQRFTVHYSALPYEIKEDAEVAAQSGPLSAGTPPGAPARPDEGDALRRGWKNTRFVSRFVDPASRVITMRPGIVRYVEAEVEKRDAIPESLPFTQSRATVQYTWHMVPIDAIPRAAWNACMNCVNSQDFDGFLAGTLLCTDVKLKHLRGPLGDRLVDIEYRLLWMPNTDHLGVQYGWNSVIRVRSGQIRYWKVSSDGDPATADDNDRLIFKRADLTSLFRPDQA